MPEILDTMVGKKGNQNFDQVAWANMMSELSMVTILDFGHSLKSSQMLQTPLVLILEYEGL